jgi:hypothetical protein
LSDSGAAEDRDLARDMPVNSFEEMIVRVPSLMRTSASTSTNGGMMAPRRRLGRVPEFAVRKMKRAEIILP